MAKLSITDIPRDIRKGEQDTFGIAPFEKGLIRFIESTNTPITIALQGEWGSGKTSLMNSLNQELCSQAGAKFHHVWLNTWEYALMKDAQSTLLDIITGLIREVSKIAKVEESQTEKIVGKLWKVGKVAANFAVRKAANIVVDGSSEVIDAAFASDEQKSSIGEIRSELEAIIASCIEKDQKQGFIFFIDDLDRIDPPVAVELLELLKNIFTLKNCVFILAIDYDVVVKGLEPKFGKLTASNEREFRSFFDKIIQVPFSMPVASYKADVFLKSSLKSICYLNDKQTDDEKLISRFTEIANLTVGSNPRALKRLLNSISLISCINQAKDGDEESMLTEDNELLINFALVSIQIAYPPIYDLLAVNSGFDNWDESVAVKYNLKALDQSSILKLNALKEFDEEWEQVLYRFCENDLFLKKKALNISRLLNLIKDIILSMDDEVENVVSSIISLSSVTNLKAFDEPVVNYNKSKFLKCLRTELVSRLKKAMPDKAGDIIPYKRVQTNAHIRLSPDGERYQWLKIHTQPIDGNIRNTHIYGIQLYKKKSGIKDIYSAMRELGLLDEYQGIEADFNKLTEAHPNFSQRKMFEGRWGIELNTYSINSVEEDFFAEQYLEDLTSLLVDQCSIISRLYELKTKIMNLTNEEL